MRKIICFLFFIPLVSFSQGTKFGRITKDMLLEKKYPLDSRAKAAYLYKKRRTFYDYVKGEGFKVITEIHKRIKIYEQEGVNYGNINILYYTPPTGSKERVFGIKAYTFNLVDGEIEKTEISKKSIFNEKKSKYKSVKKVVLPNVKQGSVLDVKYKIISPYSYSLRDVVYQYGIPLKKFQIKIEIPEYYKFNKISKGYYFAKSEEKRKNGTISFSLNRSLGFIINKTTFSGNNVPALRDDEPYIGNANNYRGGVKYELSSTQFPNSIIESYTTSWEKVSEKIYELSSFGGELKKINYFKKDLSNIISDITIDKQKIEAILKFVKSKVKWNGYEGIYVDKGVRKAYKEGVGNVADINLMLTSMLRESGLNANPVLVSTKNHGIPIFPTIDGFNYVISIVEFEDNSYVLLDATETYSTSNILPNRVLNWRGRKVTKSGMSNWVQLMPISPVLEENSIYAKIVPEDFTVKGFMNTKYRSLNALNYRSNNNNLSDDEILTKLEERYTIEIDNFKILNKKNLEKDIGVMIGFTNDNVTEEINNKLYVLPLLHLTQIENVFKGGNRKYPIDFTCPWVDKNKVTIKIPKGYLVESMPETLAIGLPENLGLFKYRVVEDRGRINVFSLLQINQAIILPQYYQAIKEFYRKIIAKQNEKIILIKN